MGNKTAKIKDIFKKVFDRVFNRIRWEHITFNKVEEGILYEYNVAFKKKWYDNCYSNSCPYTSMRIALKMGNDNGEIYCVIANKEEIKR